MKRLLVISSLILMVSMVSLGCQGASSCWTRNGSRVPTGVAATATPQIPMDGAQIMYSSGCNACSAATTACNPCSTSCNACDPCSTSTQANFGTMPGQ